MPDVIIPERRRDLGNFEVGRMLPHPNQRMVGPFIFFDHMGPVHMPAGLPRSADVRPHPHIGLATVTYLFEGEIMHRDSVGSEQPIIPGEMNWMVAGRGITHSERFGRARREGGPLHGLQAWVALPNAEEECEPSFTHHGPGDLPALEAEGVQGRLIAGEAFGKRARVATLSPLFYVHWQMEAGAAVELPPEYPQRAVHVAAGAVEVGGQRYDAGRMLVFASGRTVAVRALEPSIVMGLGGEPVGSRFIEWNFVSSSRSRIDQAKADWRAGRMKLPDLDSGEFIPLPPEPGAPANPMS